MADRLQAARFDVDQLLNQLLDRTREIIPFDSGGIAIYDPNSGYLAPRTYVSGSDDAPLPRLIRPGEGIVGLCAQLLEPLLVDDVQSDIRYIPYDSATQSQIAVPIVFNQQLLGVFTLESYQPFAFSRQHQVTLYALADQAALALHTVQLYQELAGKYDKLTDHNAQLVIRNDISRLATSDQPLVQTLPAIAELVCRMIDADACAFTLWDENNARTKRLAAYGIDIDEFLNAPDRQSGAPSLTREIVAGGKPIILNELHRGSSSTRQFLSTYNAASFAGLPLVVRGRVIGAMFLMNFTDGRHFTNRHTDALTSVQNQIALAIDNGFLLKDTEARHSETSVLLEIAAIAASSLELDEMVAQAMRLSRRILGVTAGMFLIYDRASNWLYPRPGAAFGVPDGLLKLKFPVNDPTSRISVVFTSGTGSYINDMAISGETIREAAFREHFSNLMIAPLRVQDEPLGVFLVGGKPGGFVRGDLDLVVGMGSHVAAALRNAELLDATSVQLRETRALQRIAAITSATFDLDEMLRQVVSEAANLLDTEGAFVYLPDETDTILYPHIMSLYGLMRGIDMPMISINETWHIPRAFVAAESFVSNDPASDPLLHQRNLITYPLSVRKKTLGVISFVNRRHGDFEDTHIELVRTIAGQIAVSLENVGLFNAERRRADLMSIISRIGQELTATLDLPGLMRKVVRSIHELLGYDAVCIYLLDETGTIATVQSGTSHLIGVLLPDGTSFPISQGITGRAMRLKQTQVVADLRVDPDFFWPYQEQNRAMSCMVVLLRNRERVLGAIEIYSAQVGGFDDPDTTAIETLATQVSTVIENARLWDQAQRRLLEQGIVHQIGQDLSSILEYSDLVNAVVRHMTRALDTALCILVSYVNETGQLLVEAEYRVAEIAGVVDHPLPRMLGTQPAASEYALLMKTMASRRHAIWYNGDMELAPEHQVYFDTVGVNAEMAIPMIAGDRVIGGMVWIETRGARRFTESDIRLAQTLTTQAAIAIENARLYRQAQRQAHEQAILRSIAVSLSMLSSLADLLRIFPNQIADAIKADNVVLSLPDDDGIYRVRAHSLMTRSLSQTILGRIDSYAPDLWSVLALGGTVQVSHTITPDSNATRELRRIVDPLRPGAWIIIPIMRRQEPVGLIEINRDSANRVFSHEDITLLEALAGQGSTAIENIMLYEREQFRLRQLEKVQVSGRLLSSQLHVQKLMELIVAEVARIFNAPAVSLVIPAASAFEHRASFGLSEAYVLKRKLSLNLAQGDGPLYAAEISREIEEADQLKLIADEDLCSVLGVSLNKAGEQLAWLLIYSKGRVRIFSDEEREIAQLFAGQAAVALENARLFQELEQRAIELAKANKLRSEFLARVSHELRTPMNSINGYSEMLLRSTYGTLNEKQTDRLERILRNGRNLLAIIDDLLDISKIDAGKMELRFQPISLRDELTSTIYALESQATAKGLYLRSEIPEGLPNVRADSVRVKQVMTNLLGNALKFTKQGGVTIRAGIVFDNTREMLFMSVIDTGIGIRVEDQHIIFDEFRQVDGSATREFGGTGLGLAITKKLVELMGGRIWVESTPDLGSNFTFTLPVEA